MNKRILFLIIALLLSGYNFAQSQIDEVSRALYAGDAAKVGQYFDKVVEVTINNEQSNYSKSQAESVLKTFFSRVGVKSFAVKHKGNASTDNSIFLIGDLVTESGQFRTYLFFKQKEKNLYLLELRFED